MCCGHVPKSPHSVKEDFVSFALTVPGTAIITGLLFPCYAGACDPRGSSEPDSPAVCSHGSGPAHHQGIAHFPFPDRPVVLFNTATPMLTNQWFLPQERGRINLADRAVRFGPSLTCPPITSCCSIVRSSFFLFPLINPSHRV